MMPPIKDFDELSRVVCRLEGKVDELFEKIHDGAPSAEVLRLALEVVDLSCGIAKADLAAILPPDELSDPRQRNTLDAGV